MIAKLAELWPGPILVVVSSAALGYLIRSVKAAYQFEKILKLIDVTSELMREREKAYGMRKEEEGEPE